MKVIINIILAFALLSLLSGCQKSASFDLPRELLNASIETVVSSDIEGSFYLVSRKVDHVELDISEPTFVIFRIHLVDEISYEGKIRYVRWITSFRLQKGWGLRIMREVEK